MKHTKPKHHENFIQIWLQKNLDPCNLNPPFVLHTMSSFSHFAKSLEHGFNFGHGVLRVCGIFQVNHRHWRGSKRGEDRIATLCSNQRVPIVHVLGCNILGLLSSECNPHISYITMLQSISNFLSILEGSKWSVSLGICESPPQWAQHHRCTRYRIIVGSVWPSI